MSSIWKIFELLYLNQVRYLVCGGLAMNIYGIPRMTADIDLIIDFDAQNLEKFHKVLSELNYKPLLPLNIVELAEKTKRDDLLKNKNLIVFSYHNHQNNSMAVDLLIDVPMDFESLNSQRVERKMGSCKVYLTSVEDLIKLKERANRTQDIQDIKMLLKYVKA